MKFEFSSGGIVFRPPSPVRGEDRGEIEVLLCQHSQNHSWGFPKGLIGDTVKGESKERTALREVEEETGVKGEIVDALEPITYWYVFKGEKIKKTVYYYVMKYLGGNISKHDFEMEDVEWIEADKVLDRLTFKADNEVFTNALPLIEKMIDKRQ